MMTMRRHARAHVLLLVIAVVMASLVFGAGSAQGKKQPPFTWGYGPECSTAPSERRDCGWSPVARPDGSEDEATHCWVSARVWAQEHRKQITRIKMRFISAGSNTPGKLVRSTGVSSVWLYSPTFPDDTIGNWAWFTLTEGTDGFDIGYGEHDIWIDLRGEGGWWSDYRKLYKIGDDITCDWDNPIPYDERSVDPVAPTTTSTLTIPPNTTPPPTAAPPPRPTSPPTTDPPDPSPGGPYCPPDCPDVSVNPN